MGGKHTHEDRGRCWSHAAASQGMSEATQSWERQGRSLLLPVTEAARLPNTLL